MVDAQTGQIWDFRVLLDDKDIGAHTFVVSMQGDTEVLESRAEFDVRVLLLRVYRCRHENTEVWRNGCLARITAQTDDNGEPYQVSGERRDAIFNVVTLESVQTLAQDCVMTVATAQLTDRQVSGSGSCTAWRKYFSVAGWGCPNRRVSGSGQGRKTRYQSLVCQRQSTLACVRVNGR